MRYLNCRDELEASPVWFSERAMKYETCYPPRNLELLHASTALLVSVPVHSEKTHLSRKLSAGENCGRY
ncbi:hypothetical protein BYT27DRAFT_7191765, partial [Phlegmacium glaucopus]